MRKATSKDVFFFNLFSRDIISLPKCELAFEHIAFSCPPTSDDCVLLAIKFVPADNLVTVSTCNPGATEWVTDDFPTFIRPFYMQSNLVFRRDIFYYFNAEGTLYNFDPSYRTWNYICVDKLICPYVHEKQYVWHEKAVVLVEKKGEIFVMFTCSNEKPMVYKLFSLEWKEMSRTTLDGLTFFVIITVFS
ncbi:F-box protein [Arabidopsis thaliana]